MKTNISSVFISLKNPCLFPKNVVHMFKRIGMEDFFHIEKVLLRRRPLVIECWDCQILPHAFCSQMLYFTCKNFNAQS